MINGSYSKSEGSINGTTPITYNPSKQFIKELKSSNRIPAQTKIIMPILTTGMQTLWERNKC